MKLTPGMKQYMDNKNKHPDCILLFRMGDFYECFFEDAIKVSKILNITLTSRGKGESKAPLSGIPYHSLEKYLKTLVDKGNKVAICEQVEDPKEAKGIVKREVVRIVTPGTIIEDSMLNQNSNNFIASIFGDGNNLGLAFIELSTGEFKITEVKRFEDAIHEISRKKTAEVIISSGLPLPEVEKFCKKNEIFVNKISETKFWIQNAKESLSNQFSSINLNHKEFAICAAGALVSHLRETQKQNLAYLKKPKLYSVNEFMVVDSATIKNLELLKNIHSHSTKGSLLSVLDSTKTSMGGRLLRHWITHPLKDENQIKYRTSAVKELKEEVILCDDLRDTLNNIFDIERLVSKISYKLTNPRDIVTLKNSLEKTKIIQDLLKDSTSQKLQNLIEFDDVSSLIELIKKSISEENDSSNEIVRGGSGYSQGGSGRRETGFVKSGFNTELDSLYDLKLNTKLKIHELQTKEQESTGMTLKVGYNKVFGYYIEVSNKFKDKVPAHYIRKQTLVNGERFITQDLKEFEEKLLNADEKIIKIENKILNFVIEEITKNTKKLQSISHKIAKLDVISNFAKISYNNNYIEPIINHEYNIDIKDSRHPVIEQIEKEFIPNDCLLSKDENEFLMLITGPNMAGKSTFMRQIAINILMAQIGCFVPASYAKIGIVDQIFTRVGAYDDLSMGQSTFMVEMLETANILNNATSKSFIVLDEIGRGTSTFDGVAIAWSVAEYILSKIKAKTLFATHYHVLTKLQEHEHKGIVNYNIAVAEENDEIIFLRKIKRGGTNKSYGIQVAKLAGLPNDAVENAKKIQIKLENDANLAQQIIIEKKVNEELEILKQKDLNSY